MTIDTNDIRRLASPAYFIAVLMVLIPAVDLVSNMIPIRMGDPAWRYGSLGLGSGFLLTPMLGMVLAVFVAATARQGMAGRVIGWINLVFGIILVPLAGLFLLDAIQVRGAVQADALSGFDVGVVKAVVKLITGAVAFGWLGLMGTKVKGNSKQEGGESLKIRPPA